MNCTQPAKRKHSLKRKDTGDYTFPKRFLFFRFPFPEEGLLSTVNGSLVKIFVPCPQLKFGIYLSTGKFQMKGQVAWKPHHKNKIECAHILARWIKLFFWRYMRWNMEVTFNLIEVEMTRCQLLMHQYSDGADKMLSTSHLQVVGINVLFCFKENYNAQREQFWSTALWLLNQLKAAVQKNHESLLNFTSFFYQQKSRLNLRE